MLGSISTGTDEDEENDKIVVVVGDDDEDFCTYLNRGAVTKRGEGGGLNPCLNAIMAGLQRGLDKPV